MFTIHYRALFEQIDVDTGFEIDDATGLLIDPDTGYLYDPKTGSYYDRQTKQLIDPATGELLDPDTLEPIQREDPNQDNIKAPQQLQKDNDTGLLLGDNGIYYDPVTKQPVDPVDGQSLGSQQSPPDQQVVDQQPTIDPDQQAVEQQQAEILDQSLKNIEKYVLYTKLLNLKYFLDSNSIVPKNAREFNEILYYLDILLAFFDTFSNDQAADVGQFLISKIKESIKTKPEKKI